MFDLNAVRETLGEKLAAEGLAVTLDPRNVNPPIIVIGLPVVTGWPGPCAIACDIDITAVAPAPGNLDAVEQLLSMVGELLGLFPQATASPSSFETQASSPLPAYTLTVTTTATDEG
jgi:hypothetical protein